MVEQAVSPQEGGHNYMVAVDGSEASELAFTVAMHGLFRPQCDSFNVITITDSKKEYLPFQYKPAFIEEKYQAKIYANAQSGSAKFIKREVQDGKSTKEMLWSVCQEYNADIIVTGMHGRKGPKADLTIAGSAVKFLAQQAKTVAILKDTNMTPVKERYRFGVLFDTSDISMRCLKQTHSMMNEQDRLTVITVHEQGVNTDNITEMAKQALGGEQPCDFALLQRPGGQSIKDRVKEYLREQSENDEYIDFCTVGSRGINVGNAVDGENFLGHVAQAMIGMKRLNVIFVP